MCIRDRLLDVLVPGLVGRLVNHPVGDPDQHDDREERRNALEELLVRARQRGDVAEEEGQAHGQAEGERHAAPHDGGLVLVASLGQVGEDRGDDEDCLHALAPVSYTHLTTHSPVGLNRATPRLDPHVADTCLRPVHQQKYNCNDTPALRPAHAPGPQPSPRPGHPSRGPSEPRHQEHRWMDQRAEPLTGPQPTHPTRPRH